MTQPGEPAFAALELCDRAARFISERGSATEDELLAHVYGGATPSVMRDGFAAPLLADPRLRRDVDGVWRLRASAAPTRTPEAFTALSVVGSGPNPTRARVVRLVALHVENGAVQARFDVTLDPGRRVPRYAADRAGLEPEAFEGLPSFATILDDLAAFLEERPLLAQDAHLAWGFIAEEARRCGRVLPQPALIDLDALASATLDLKTKPTLALVAAQCGISTTRIAEPDEEARALFEVGARLLERASIEAFAANQPATTLRRASTARDLPDRPGVYILRDREQRTLYVGKARRLRTRMTAYVHRPLGATRRLEGLVGSVEGVDTTDCEHDLEALIVENREIRRLQPRFNTVRQQNSPRFWIFRPPWRTSAKGRPLAAPRLELSEGPSVDDIGDFLGPFRNEMLADQARQLARDVFELDAVRRGDPWQYTERLDAAWRFLHGETATAEKLARQRSVTLLRKVLAFRPGEALLPADSRQARYAVVRPAPAGVELFVLERAVLVGFGVLEADDDSVDFVARVFGENTPQTTPEDEAVVLRWFGAQHPPARLVWLADDPLRAADAVQDALLAIRQPAEAE